MGQDLISHFSLVEEPRSEKNKLYPLEEILLLCICAVVGGAEGWKDIAAFGRIKLDRLRQFLPYVDGIPSDDCIGWGMASSLSDLPPGVPVSEPRGAMCCVKETVLGEKRGFSPGFPYCRRKAAMRFKFHARQTRVHSF